MSTLAEIVEQGDLPTDKTTCHSYESFYDAALEPYRGRSIRLLEIGVNRGGSLRLWDAYFAGLAAIVGVDVNLDRVDQDARDCATLVQGDAYTEATVAAPGTFDIIIDDGPHTLESQLAAVRLYAPRLRPGGMLVIEDVQSPDWIAALAAVVPFGRTWEAIDLEAETGVTDDRLFVVRRSA